MFHLRSIIVAAFISTEAVETPARRSQDGRRGLRRDKCGQKT